ncbi:MAG: hypothetical protein Q8P12_02990, partial [bacterium]|nr:hypothetical protein [bacterium]
MPQSANKPGKQKKKAPRSAWKKGISGNPCGRPKLPQEVKDLREYCRSFSREAIDIAIGIMRDKDESNKIRMDAIRLLIEHGIGKPPQALTGPDGEKIPISFTLKLGDDDSDADKKD